MNSAMDSSSSTGSGWLIYMLPMLAARPGGAASSLSIAGFIASCWVPLVLLLSGFIASALVCWCFPGGPAWGCLRLGGSKKKFRSLSIPGPRGLPVVGSLLEMGGLAHRRLAHLARTHSAQRLMALSLGSTRLVISSAPDVARELLNSTAFADRPLKQSAQQLMFGRAIGFAPYGDYWRRLRRVALGCLFSPRRIAAHEQLRQHETDEMLAAIEKEAMQAGGGAVQVRGFLQRASLNSIMGSVFGRKFVGEQEKELQGMVREGFELLGAFNWADHMPWLQEWDPQGVVQRCRALVPRVNAFVQRIIDEHRQDKFKSAAAAAPGDSGDFVDVLLSLQGEDKLEDADMVAVLWEMIFRGTDTTAILTEWVLAELVLNPCIQRKLQSEIDSVCGSSGRPVQDCDVEKKMPYLQAVVNETLRLHPPGPLLSWARLAVHDVDVAGYHVPAGTTAMVNMWAITHDSGIWAQPDKFIPERFVEQPIDVRGNDLRLAPFGAGRRVCPGRALGLATVRLWVARLVQHFFWMPCHSSSSSSSSSSSPVDLSEVLKLSCEMVKPLKARPVPRSSSSFSCSSSTSTSSSSSSMASSSM